MTNMRERRSTTDVPTSFSVTLRGYDSGDLLGSAGPIAVGAANFDSFYMKDVVTGSFQRRRAAGEFIVNPLTSAHSRVTSSAPALGYTGLVYDWNGSSWIRRTTNDCSTLATVSGTYTARYVLPQPALADVCGGTDWDALLNTFDYAAVRDTESGLVARAFALAGDDPASALVTVAEAKKTMAMFYQGCVLSNKILEFTERLNIENFRRLKRMSMKELVKSEWHIAKLWLTYRYGIMATYYDVMSWFEAGSRVGTKRRGRYVSTTYTSYDSEYSESIVGGDAYRDSWSGSRKTRQTKSSAGCVVQIEPEQSALDTFGVKHILTAGWELVPYSFVIDWFIDVGTRLAAYEGSIIRPHLGSWITHRSELMRHLHARDVPKTTIDGNVKRQGINFSTEATMFDNCTYVERIANPTLSALPAINIKLNNKRVLDGLALLVLGRDKFLQKLVR